MNVWKNFYVLNSGYVMELYDHRVKGCPSVNPTTPKASTPQFFVKVADPMLSYETM